MTKLVTNKKNKYLRPLIGSALVGTSLFQLALPVLAQTAAGTTISNTATATYEDPNNPGTPIPTQSNTVTITVAEVAGITNVAQVPIDPNGGSVIQGDIVQFPFLITNIGNAATNVFIPGPDGVTTTNLTGVTVVADLDGNGTFETTVPNGGFTTTIPIAPGASITVRIEGTVAAVPVGTQVTAQLGNTNSNTSSNPDSQNQPDVFPGGDTGGETNDVRTVDANAGNGAPVNGEREAADTAIPLIVGQIPPTPVALATIRKTSGTTVINNPQLITDDQITYNLSLEVAATSPNPAFTPGDLEGTTINLDGTPVDRIIISDVIPTGTTLQQAPIPPAGWSVVYSTEANPATTSPVVSGAATATNWTSTLPPLASVTRIGFVKNDTLPVNRGTTVSGFSFTVVSTGATGTSFNVDNVAQVLGQTVGDTANNIIFDESGDNNPLNFRDDGNPPDGDGNGVIDPFNPATDTGVVANSDGIDTNNNNTGTDTPGDTTPDGEINRVTLTVFTTSLLNGPNGAPDAVGPNDFNNDFQNQSLPAADFAPGNLTVNTTDPALTTITNPSPVNFTNTFRNNSNVRLDNIVLRPIAASQSDAATASTGRYELDANGDGTLDTIPIGTTATITVTWDAVNQNQTGGAAVTQTATYTYQANGISPGVNGFVLTGGTAIDLDNVPVGLNINYTVNVELPANTPQLRGYSIPVIAYVNNDVAEQFNPAVETTFNIKIDRLYTGYLRLIKEARLLPGTGPAIQGTQGTFTRDGTTLTPATGNIIEYRITYDNISTASSGTGNRILDANNVQITENGFTGGNTWALDADTNGTIDTTHIAGGAAASQGTIQYYNGNPATLGTEQSGPTQASNVTQYVNGVGTVAPQGTGTFTFQRGLN